MVNSYGSKEDSRWQYDVLASLETPYGETTGLEFGVVGHTLPKMGSLARPYEPRCSILFPSQNYHGQSIGAALLASPFASFITFPQKHDPNVVSPLRSSPFERRKFPRPHFFCPFDVRLAVTDVLHSTRTMPSV